MISGGFSFSLALQKSSDPWNHAQLGCKWVQIVSLMEPLCVYWYKSVILSVQVSFWTVLILYLFLTSVYLESHFDIAAESGYGIRWLLPGSGQDCKPESPIAKARALTGRITCRFTSRINPCKTSRSRLETPQQPETSILIFGQICLETVLRATKHELQSWWRFGIMFCHSQLPCLVEFLHGLVLVWSFLVPLLRFVPWVYGWEIFTSFFISRWGMMVFASLGCLLDLHFHRLATRSLDWSLPIGTFSLAES